MKMNERMILTAGEMDGAVSSLQHCLSQDSTYGDAHLLMAQIHQHRGNHVATSQYLETALSYNFEVRTRAFCSIPRV